MRWKLRKATYYGKSRRPTQEMCLAPNTKISGYGRNLRIAMDLTEQLQFCKSTTSYPPLKEMSMCPRTPWAHIGNQHIRPTRREDQDGTKGRSQGPTSRDEPRRIGLRHSRQKRAGGYGRTKNQTPRIDALKVHQAWRQQTPKKTKKNKFQKM